MSTPKHTPHRYLLFAGEKYYPAMGWHDFIRSTSDLESAQLLADSAVLSGRSFDWAHVVDMQSMSIVSEKRWATPWNGKRRVESDWDTP